MKAVLQYNARPHRACVVNDFLQQQQGTHMNWPARSLDLDPSKHLWDVLSDERDSTTLQQLTLTTSSTSGSRSGRWSHGTSDPRYLTASLAWCAGQCSLKLASDVWSCSFWCGHWYLTQRLTLNACDSHWWVDHEEVKMLKVLAIVSCACIFVKRRGLFQILLKSMCWQWIEWPMKNLFRAFHHSCWQQLWKPKYALNISLKNIWNIAKFC